MREWYEQRTYQLLTTGGSLAIGILCMLLTSWVSPPTDIAHILLLLFVVIVSIIGAFFLLSRVFAKQLDKELDALIHYYYDDSEG
jgi:drug/metabolite transporter (DMT)-like permease